MKQLRALKSLLAGGASLLALANPAAAKLFNVPGGDLATVLGTYMRQSGVDIVYMDDVVRGHRSQGAKGNYTETAALTQILRGTGFAAQTMPSNAIGIVPEKSATALVKLAQAARRTPAAPMPAPAPAIETVTVTAQKKQENIQSVPISITAMSQQQLTDRQIAAGPDLIRDVPNMNFGKTNFSGYSIELRGIGTQAISVTTDPAVAVAFNGIPFLRNHFFEQEFFDVSDVEVLRGPQGTLYGRNATAGVVNLKSALPTDTYEAMLSADLGNYSNRRLEGMLNIPIVGDQLDIRFAGEWTKRDGYTIDTDYNTPVDGRDLWSGRMTISWKPVSNLQTYFIWEHFSEDDDRLRSGKQLCETDQPVTSVNGQAVPPPNITGTLTGNAGYLGQQNINQGCVATSLYAPTAFQVPYGFSLPYVIALQARGFEAPINPYAETTQSTNLRDIQSTILPTYKAKNDTLEFNATWNINPALTLTSQTGFNEDSLWSTEDYNRFDTAPGVFAVQPGVNPIYFPSDHLSPDPNIPGALVFCDPQLGCSDRLVAEDLSEEHAWQLSQEFRVASNFGGPFNFSTGVNYLHYETEENYYVFANALSLYSYNHGGGAPYLGSPGCLVGKGGPVSYLQSGNIFGGGYQWPNPIVGGGTPLIGCVYVDPNPIGSLNNLGHNYYLNQNPYTLNSYAAFGETYYNITDDLKLTTGLRFTVDQKHFVEIPTELLDQGIGFWVNPAENQEWDRPTGRAVLDWTPKLDFTDQTLIYASYAHGYKAGGANPPSAVFLTFFTGDVTSVDHPLTFKPEYIEAFELGTKNTLLDGALTLNGDVFYYNYTGYQISEIVDRTAINNNYNAHIEGAELESVWEPLPGLKFNFAGGWEDTVAAGGDTGIDLMDRTAGTPGWMVVKPSPTQASNCIVPDYVIAAALYEQGVVGGYSSGPEGALCAIAYGEHLDPITGLPYVPNPTISASGYIRQNSIPAGYLGFNPSDPAINDGEGFLKNLSGHQLPNAPPFTVSLGGEYSMPVSDDWVATLRSDFYWQDDSWARIFNDNPYDRLHGYTNVNLALILNSANGWQVMGYVKNVFNVTAITGDFLNSDDSGLTTNVFLTDPRLYGVRVTKQLDDADGFWGSEYSGADFFTGLFSDKDGGTPPLWVELGGQIEHIAGQGAAYAPGFLSKYSTSAIFQTGTTPVEAQQPPLFSAGEEVKISYRPDDSDWLISASIRYGRSGSNNDVHHQDRTIHYNKYQSGHPINGQGKPQIPAYSDTTANFVDTVTTHQESHFVVDFMAGKDVGLGMFGLDGSSVFSAGVRIAQFTSHSSVDMHARPDLQFHQIGPFPSFGILGYDKFPFFHTYVASESASRNFKGIGPSISWNGSAPVTGNQAGGIDFDWGANAALLFGRQKTRVQHQGTGFYHPEGNNQTPTQIYQAAGSHASNRAVTVPNLGGFAGISYVYRNAKISLGYRADFFFGAIDGGIDKRRSETLDMGGPFATISFGLGG